MERVRGIRAVFQIEYILIFIATLAFCSTELFKQLAMQRFDRLNQYFYENRTDQMQREIVPYLYFDESLRSLDQRSSAFQRAIRAKQRTLFFGYDCLSLSAVILLTIAVAVIISKRTAQKAEIARITAIHNEQHAFSRNLHDGVAQDLMAIKIYSQKNDVEKCAFYTDRALHEVRYLIDAMHLPFAEGLESVLRQTLRAFADNYAIATDVLITSTALDKLSAEQQMELLMIFHEVLSNIARHAHATSVAVKIADVGDGLHIVISDNGTGFSPEALAHVNASADEYTPPHQKHWGLRNMRERVEKLHGTVEFICDGGTTIAIRCNHLVH